MCEKRKIRETPKCSRIFLHLSNARYSYFSETVLRNPKHCSVVFLVENFGALRACPPPSHSRCASLDTLAPSAPCFGRFRCVKNNTQLFLTCYPVLEEIIAHLGLFRYTKSSALAGLFVFVRIVLYRRGRRPRRPERM